ncbi:MAG: hypothetical protein E7446_09010 [Ruminococcaceae bacterium]|nr:hypothetical protein [Oscillospiraceae bacterium]
MKMMEKMKIAITALVGLCLLCAVAAFFLPNAQGMVLSYLAIALAAIVAVLCVAGMILLMNNRNVAA